ncbi:hypothetical protein BH09VER1_BH09VER1_28160 [soil metagenome]
MIKACLKAAGITKVIWIDDFFAIPQRNELDEMLRKLLVDAKQIGQTEVAFEDFVFDLAKSISSIHGQCDEIFPGLSDDKLRKFCEVLKNVEITSPNKSAEIDPDLTDDEFSELKRELGNFLRFFSLGTWTSSGALEFKNADANTLFLIDKQFKRENPNYDGLDILKVLVEKTNAFCIMFTHTCTEKSQNEARVEFAISDRIPRHKFSVLSKQQEGATQISDRFARALFSAFTHRFTGELAFTLSESIKQKIESVAEELASQSVFDLDRAFFQNSKEEGVSEFDVLARIFSVAQKHSINSNLLSPELQEQIRKTREFRKNTSAYRIKWPGSDGMTFFRYWRKHEVFLDAKGLNSLHAPLCCGDVFKRKEGDVKYVFLAQPCDIMVRQDGRRRTSVGLLAPIKEGTLAQGESSGYRFYEIRGVFDSDKTLRIDFLNVIVVDVCVLDLAVFNNEGEVEIIRDQPEPAIALTEGWLRRFKKAKALFFSPDGGKSLPITVGQKADEFEASLGANKVTYPLQRDGRFDATIATALMAGWATFQTRAALEHDFAFDEPQAIPEANMQAGTAQ